MDRIYDRYFSQPAGTPALWMPAVDVRETNDEIQVTAELPGLRSEDVSVTMENGVLTINGGKKQEFQGQGAVRGRRTDDHAAQGGERQAAAGADRGQRQEVNG